jgi:WD40 repeat protein
MSLQEVRQVLDEEIGQLPEKYRAPLVLCYLEDNSYEKAARELGCPKSSLDRRLARARQLLRRRLERRGIMLSVVALTTGLAEMAFAAPLPAMLTIKTIKAGALVAAGKSVTGCLSTGAVALAEEAVAGMLGIKGKMVLLVLMFGLAVGGAGWASRGRAQKVEPLPSIKAPFAQEVAVGAAQKESVVALDQYGDALPEGKPVRLGTVRLAHNGHISGAAFSPDGKLIASIGWDEAIRLWDRSTARPIRALRLKQKEGTLSLAFSPSGEQIAAGSERGFVRLWDVQTGKLLFEKQGHGGRVLGVAFAPDGGHFASAGGNVRVWHAATGREVLNLQPPAPLNESYGVQGVAYSPDGKLLAASRGECIHVWNSNTGASHLTILKAHKDREVSIAFCNSDCLVSVEGGLFRFWGMATGKLLRELKSEGRFGGSMALSANSNFLASTAPGKIRILDSQTGEATHVFPDPGNAYASANYLAFSPDGKSLAARAGDNTLRVWDLDTGKRKPTFSDTHTDGIRATMFSPDGSQVLTSGGEGTVRLWDTRTARQLRLYSAENVGGDTRFGGTVATFSPNGKLIAAGGYDDSEKKRFGGSCRIWDAATGKELYVATFSNRVKYLAFSPDGKSVAIATAEFSARENKAAVFVWDFSAWFKSA